MFIEAIKGFLSKIFKESKSILQEINDSGSSKSSNTTSNNNYLKGKSYNFSSNYSCEDEEDNFKVNLDYLNSSFNETYKKNISMMQEKNANRITDAHVGNNFSTTYYSSTQFDKNGPVSSSYIGEDEHIIKPDDCFRYDYKDQHLPNSTFTSPYEDDINNNNYYDNDDDYYNNQNYYNNDSGYDLFEPNDYGINDDSGYDMWSSDDDNYGYNSFNDKNGFW